MARPYKYSTEELIDVIKLYIEVKGPSHIKSTELAKFAREETHLTSIYYQVFDRNEVVKAFINDFNSTVEDKITDARKKGYLTHERYIDATKLFGKSNGEITTTINEFNQVLKVIYAQNIGLERSNNALKKGYRELQAKINDFEQKNYALQNKLGSKNARIYQLEDQLAKNKETIELLKKYVDEQIVNPNLIKNISKNGWVTLESDDVISESKLLDRSLEDVVLDYAKYEDVDTGNVRSKKEIDCIEQLKELQNGDIDNEVK